MCSGAKTVVLTPYGLLHNDIPGRIVGLLQHADEYAHCYA
jgi:hypothetical protein